MLTISHVSKTFGQCHALEDVDMTVPDGAVYGLAGPNGAGKSTLINHICAVTCPDTGTIELDGAPVFENPAAKARIACIPSEFYFWHSATIAQMANFYKRLFPSFDSERFKELGKHFDLNLNVPIRTFSKGMVRQAAFWLTLSRMPDILVMDEPMDGLDPLVRKLAWGLVMNEVSARGMTVVVSSHNLRELEGLCDRLGIMHKGRMLREYDLSDPAQSLVKVQIALPDGQGLPDDLMVLQQSSQGKLDTLILRGNPDDLQKRLQALEPLVLEILPLSLEELFLYEVGGVDDEIKKLFL